MSMSTLKCPTGLSISQHPTKQQCSSSTSFCNDHLGKIVSHSVTHFLKLSSWAQYVLSTHGEVWLTPTVGDLPHLASSLLDHICHQGAPATMTSPLWPQGLLQACLCWGPHKSTLDHADFVQAEMTDFCEKGFWMVLPYELVQHLPNLCLSPVGVMPQCNWRPQLIVDLSFWGINAETLPRAPPEVMQFGWTLEQTLYHIQHANLVFGPVYVGKYDCSDAFYHFPLAPNDALSLAVLLPQHSSEPPLVAIPFALPMGWIKSPLQLCSATEMAANLMNYCMYLPYSPPH